MNRGTFAIASLGLLSIGMGARASDFDVVISEIHYHVFTRDGDASLEFVEIHNSGRTDVALDGWSFVRGVRWTFERGTVLPSGGYLVVSPAPAVARLHYALERVVGPWEGRLDNDGEILELTRSDGRVVSRVHYDDDAPWPSLPDGRGATLELATIDSDIDRPDVWRASRTEGGTPGAPASGSTPVPLPMLNEVGDHDGPFVELFHGGEAALQVSGWRLRSDLGLDLLFAPAPPLAPGAHRVLREGLAGQPGLWRPDQETRLLLLGGDGEILDVLDVPRRPAGLTAGRYPDGDEDAFALAEPTPGAPNLYRGDRRVVIAEIFYHPPWVAPSEGCLDRCSDALQWIELLNRSDETVDLGGWSLSKGIRFEVPAGLTLPPGERLVIAASLPTFRGSHPDVANVVGDFAGRLGHGSDTINLRDALGNRVDHVRYGDGGQENDEEPRDGEDDGTFRAGYWPTAADGSGRSLELVHPWLDNRQGGAWRASMDEGGSPGTSGSEPPGPIPPAVDDVEHFPPVPDPEEEVRVSCRISTIDDLRRAEVEWAVDGEGADGEPAAVLPLEMEGARPADDLVESRRWSAVLPPRPDGSIVRFRIRVETVAGSTIVFPPVPRVAPYEDAPPPSCLYEVDATPEPGARLPVYRVLMSERDRAELRDRPRTSDVLLSASFVGDGRIWHGVGVRFRGENSRRDTNRSYRVEFPPERPMRGIVHLNLNGSNGDSGASNFAELMAVDLVRRAGDPYPQVWPVALHFPGEVERDFDTRYIRKEHLDSDFLERFFGGADGGWLYRARNPDGPGADNADLEYRGEDPEAYRPLYVKRSRREEDDFSDVIELTRAFDPDETPDESFAEAVEPLIDARQWARFFALQACLVNRDGGIWTNNGEDYLLYHLPADPAREDSGRWVLVPWDLEETFRDPTERLFRPSVPTIRRFLATPRFARLYHQELDYLRDTIHTRRELRRRYAVATRMFSPPTDAAAVARVDTHVAARSGWLEEVLPRGLVVGGERGVDEVTIVPRGAHWSFFRGVEDPPGGDLDWTTLDYDEGGWETGEAGFGYGDEDDETVLDDMEDGYTTVFVRHRFEIAAIERLQTLFLRVDYDDAFVAYLNGVELARSQHAPAEGPIGHDATAADSHEATGGVGEYFDVSLHRGDLVAGPNVLALVGINRAADSSDFSLSPSLAGFTIEVGTGLVAGCGDRIVTDGSRLRLSGRAPPALSRSVTVDGQEAPVELITTGGGPYGAAWQTTVDLVDSPGAEVLVRAHDAPGGAGSLVDERFIRVARASPAYRLVDPVLEGDVEWAESDGALLLRGVVEVGPDSRLRVGPGTQVYLAPGATLEVRGQLLVEGTADRPVSWRPQRRDAPWSGIRVEGTGTHDDAPEHRVSHARVEGSAVVDGANGCLVVRDARLRVEDCVFHEAGGVAIEADVARVDIARSTFEETLGAVLARDSSLAVEDSIVRALRGDSGAVVSTGGEGQRFRIVRSLLEDLPGGGIEAEAADGAEVEILDNVLRRVQGLAVHLRTVGSPASVVLVGNLIHEAGEGIRLTGDSGVVEAHHDTIAASGVGIRLLAAAAPDPAPLLHSSIVWNNDVGVILEAPAELRIEHSLVAGAERWPGEGNLLIAPGFIDPGGDDYSLRHDSPAIGTGRGGADMGAVGRREPREGTRFVRGDLDASDTLDITDAILTLRFLFQGGEGPACRDRGDTNDDGVVNITDAIHSLSWLFQGGPPPAPPYPWRGIDPTEDSLDCP